LRVLDVAGLRERLRRPLPAQDAYEFLKANRKG